MLVNFDPRDLFTPWRIDLFSPPDLFYWYFSVRRSIYRSPG